MSNYFPPTALIFEGFLNATKTGCSDWSPRIVWVLIEMYLLNSSKATWLDSCSALANTASCTEKFVLSVSLACPWMGFMKIKDKKNYSFFFFFKWWSTLYPQGLHKCRSHPRCCGILSSFYQDLCRYLAQNVPNHQEDRKKYNYGQNTSLYQQLLLFIVFLIQPPWPELYKVCNNITLLKRKLNHGRGQHWAEKSLFSWRQSLFW